MMAVNPGCGSIRSFRSLRFLFAALLFCAGSAAAQDTTSRAVYIEKIVIQGNKKTRPEVILRELQTRPHTTVDYQTLELDRRRLESLGLFNRVQMSLKAGTRGYILEIVVTERWYLFPFPILFFNEREISLRRLSYGAGVIHTNFRGRAELLQFYGWLGYNPSVVLDYTNPWIFGEAQMFMRLQFMVANILNKTFDIINRRVTEKQLGAGVTLGKRLSIRTSVSFSLFYQQLRLNPPVAGQTLDPKGLDRAFQFRFSYLRDYRDLSWFPTQGYYLQADVIKTGPPGGKYIDYARLFIDARKYFHLGEMTTLAFRLNVDLTRGDIPIYDRLFFGYRYRIRGHFFERYEGEHRMLFSAGFRFPIIPVRYFNLESKALGPYGQNLRYGLSGEVFFDAGTLWFQNRKERPGVPPTSGPFGMQTAPRKWLPGVGIGLNFHLPYVNILRTELAINEKRQTELIVDLAVAF